MLIRLLCVILAALVIPTYLFPAIPLEAAEPAPIPLLVFNRPPYYVLENGKAAGGFLLTAALAVFEKANISVALREMPPGRIVATLAHANTRACAVGWFKTPQRERDARFTIPLYRSRPLAVAVRRDRDITFEPPPSLGDLLHQEMNWGLREGFSYGKEFDRAFEDYPADRVNRFSDTLHMVELLAKGRLDAILVDPEELAWIVAEHPELGRQVRLVGLADAPPGVDRYIMCGRGVAPETMGRLDDAIRDFVKTDQYRALTDFQVPR